MKKIIYMFIVTLFLVSCGNKTDVINDDKKLSKTDKNMPSQEKTAEEIAEITQVKTTKYNEEKIEYDSSKWEMKIWVITIKKWKPNWLPEYLNPNNTTETYVNSNVPNYYFFVSSENPSDIWKYYTSNLKKAWFVLNKSNIESSDWNTWYSYSNKDSSIEISISKTIPENLKKMSLTGSFVEVRY